MSLLIRWPWMLFMKTCDDIRLQAPPGNHRASMRMPARRRRAAIAAVRRIAEVVTMIRDRLNIFVRVRIGVRARLPLVSATLNDVIQMGITQAVQNDWP